MTSQPKTPLEFAEGTLFDPNETYNFPIGISDYFALLNPNGSRQLVGFIHVHDLRDDYNLFGDYPRYYMLGNAFEDTDNMSFDTIYEDSPYHVNYNWDVVEEPVNQLGYLLGYWTREDDEPVHHPGWKIFISRLAHDTAEFKRHTHMLRQPATFNQAHHEEFTSDPLDVAASESRDRDGVTLWWARTTVGYMFERIVAWEAMEPDPAIDATEEWKNELGPRATLKVYMDVLCEPVRGVCVGHWLRRFHRHSDRDQYRRWLGVGLISLPNTNTDLAWRPGYQLEEIPGNDVIARNQELMGKFGDALDWYDENVGIHHIG